MKYIINLELKHNLIKSDYRPFIVSMFKHAISNYMEGYFYEKLYGVGARKSLVWSIRLNKPIFKENTIELDGTNIKITLKINEPQTAVIYFSSLLAQKNNPFNIGLENQLTLRDINLVSESEIIGNYTIFKILSPICLRQHDRVSNKDRYLTVEDEEFEVALREKIKETFPGQEQLVDDLRIDKSKLKKIVVPVYGVLIDCTIGEFLALGDPIVLNHMNKNGVGSRNNSGFGFIEAIY